MSKNYYILLNGKKIIVTKEVYYAYKRPDWTEAKRKKVRKDMEQSLELMTENGLEGLTVSRIALLEDTVVNKLLLEQLLFAVGALTDEERGLINSLFFQGKSERDFALQSGLSAATVHKRKKATLEKLKRMLGN